jgi:hypothetical protein
MTRDAKDGAICDSAHPFADEHRCGLRAGHDGLHMSVEDIRIEAAESVAKACAEAGRRREQCPLCACWPCPSGCPLPAYLAAVGK